MPRVLTSAIVLLAALSGLARAQSNLCDPNRGCGAPTPSGCEPVPNCPTEVVYPPTIIESGYFYGEDMGPRPVLFAPPTAPPTPPRGVVFVPSEPIPPPDPALKYKPPPALKRPPPAKLPPAPRTPVLVLPQEDSLYRQEPVVVVPPSVSAQAAFGPEVISVPAMREEYQPYDAGVFLPTEAPRIVQIAPVVVEEPEIVTRQEVYVEPYVEPSVSIAPTVVQTVVPLEREIQTVPVVEIQAAPIVLQSDPIVVEEPIVLRAPPPMPCMEDKSICDLNPLSVNITEMEEDGWAGMTQMNCANSDFNFAVLSVEGASSLSHRVEIYLGDASSFDWVEMNYIVNPTWPDDLNQRTGKPMWDGTLRMRDLRSASELLARREGQTPAFDLAVPEKLESGDSLWVQFGVCTQEGCFADSQLYQVNIA